MNTLVNAAQRPEFLLWFDGEYTGLNPDTDLVLEVGILATDFSLNTIASYSCFVEQDTAKVRELLDANPWWSERQKHVELMIKGCSVGKGIDEVDTALSGIALLTSDDSKAILAGNSLTKDREFIDKYLPQFASLLHYRMLDVSSFKLYAQATYGLEYPKRLGHRAMSDIQESIEEFRSLIELFKQYN